MALSTLKIAGSPKRNNPSPPPDALNAGFESGEGGKNAVRQNGGCVGDFSSHAPAIRSQRPASGEDEGSSWRFGLTGYSFPVLPPNFRAVETQHWHRALGQQHQVFARMILPILRNPFKRPARAAFRALDDRQNILPLLVGVATASASPRFQGVDLGCSDRLHARVPFSLLPLC